jgi:hypothetical protein
MFLFIILDIILRVTEIAAVYVDIFHALFEAVAYPGIFSGGRAGRWWAQQIQLRTEGRENGIWGR